MLHQGKSFPLRRVSVLLCRALGVCVSAASGVARVSFIFNGSSRTAQVPPLFIVLLKMTRANLLRAAFFRLTACVVCK